MEVDYIERAELVRLRAIEKAAREYIMDSWGTLDIDMINAARARNDERPVDTEEAALMRALQKGPEMPTEAEIQDGRLQALQSRGAEIARLREGIESILSQADSYEGEVWVERACRKLLNNEQ